MHFEILVFFCIPLGKGLLFTPRHAPPTNRSFTSFIIEQKAPLLYIKNKGHNTYSSATLATLSVSLHNRIHKFLSSTEQYSQRIGENVESRVSSRGGLFLAVINVTLGALGDEVGVVGGCRDREGLGAARTRPAHMIRHELERV